MFNQLSIWQMVIDSCLVTSILVVAFRHAKNSRAHTLLPRMIELEGRVSEMMADAEERAKALSDQLIRREQNLSRTMSEIERREREINGSLNNGDVITKELSLLCEGARREAAELERVIVEARSTATQQIATPNLRKREKEIDPNLVREIRAIENVVEVATKPEELKIALAKPATRKGAQRKKEEPRLAEPPAATKTAKRKPALKTGRAKREIDERNERSLGGVERLAQKIEIDGSGEGFEATQYRAIKAGNDPRLGALGVSRRATSAA